MEQTVISYNQPGNTRGKERRYMALNLLLAGLAVLLVVVGVVSRVTNK